MSAALPVVAAPAPSDLEPETSRGLWITKLTLRGFSFAFCIIIIGVAAQLFTLQRALTLLILGPPAGIATLWDVADGICLIVRGRRRGIHPGAIVGVDLILWLSFAGCAVILGFTHHIYLGSYARNCPDCYTDLGYEFDYTRAGGLSHASLAFSVIATILHFVVFVIGCYETNVRNRRPRVIYVSQIVSGDAAVENLAVKTSPDRFA